LKPIFQTKIIQFTKIERDVFRTFSRENDQSTTKYEQDSLQSSQTLLSKHKK